MQVMHKLELVMEFDTMNISDFQYYALLFSISLISTLLFRSFFKKPTGNSRAPPSPLALPLIGHLYLFSSPQFPISLQKIAKKYGSILSLRLGLIKCVHVAKASVAAEIFKNQDVVMSGKPKDIFKFFGTQGLVTAQYGEYWRFMKKLCMMEVLGSPQIQRTRWIRRDELTRMLHHLLDIASKKGDVNLSGELLKLTNANISRMALSTRHGGSDAEQCRQLVVDINKLAGKVKAASMLGPLKSLAYWMYGKKAIEVTKRFDELLDRIMKEHIEKAKKEGGVKRENRDLMDILLEVYDDENAEFKITKSQIKAFLRDIFVAGTTTIADTIQWAMAEVINRPNVFKKIREEVESVVGKNRLVEESDLQNLPYLQAVVKETLRLYAAVPVIHRAPIEDTKFGDYEVPKGTIVLINAYAMMRDPEAWDNPLEFIPERFMDQEKVKELSKINNFNYIPFGMGRRSCPGANLAIATAHLVVAALVQCFDWELRGSKLDTEVGINITTTMAKSIVCYPIAYNTPFVTQE